MHQWTKLGLAALATGCLFTNVTTIKAQTVQNNSSNQTTNNNESSSQSAIYQITPAVSYQVPIYFLQNNQINNGPTLNVNGYVGTQFGINNKKIVAPKGYNISKNADQYEMTLTSNGYKINRYHANQWGKYSGKIIISLNAKKVRNTTIIYQNAAGKKIKTQKISGYVGYAIKRKYLKLPKGTYIPKNATWIPHYFSAEPQQIIVTVNESGTNQSTTINNTKQTKNKTTKAKKQKSHKKQTKQNNQTTKKQKPINQNTQKVTKQNQK